MTAAGGPLPVYYEPPSGELRPTRVWWSRSMAAPTRPGIYLELGPARYLYTVVDRHLVAADPLPTDAVALIPGERPGLHAAEVTADPRPVPDNDLAALTAALEELGVRLPPGTSDSPAEDVATVVHQHGWRRPTATNTRDAVVHALVQALYEQRGGPSWHPDDDRQHDALLSDAHTLADAALRDDALTSPQEELRDVVRALRLAAEGIEPEHVRLEVHRATDRLRDLRDAHITPGPPADDLRAAADLVEKEAGLLFRPDSPRNRALRLLIENGRRAAPAGDARPDACPWCSTDLAAAPSGRCPECRAVVPLRTAPHLDAADGPCYGSGLPPNGAADPDAAYRDGYEQGRQHGTNRAATEVAAVTEELAVARRRAEREARDAAALRRRDAGLRDRVAALVRDAHVRGAGLLPAPTPDEITAALNGATTP